MPQVGVYGLPQNTTVNAGLNVMLLAVTDSPRVANAEYGISFSADFKFTYAIVLVKQQLVAAFIDGWSSELDFVGKVYEFSGRQVAEIPFPPTELSGRKNAFWYASETERGVWVGFHQQSARDFGGVFCLNSKTFVSFSEAR